MFEWAFIATIAGGLTTGGVSSAPLYFFDERSCQTAAEILRKNEVKVTPCVRLGSAPMAQTPPVMAIPRTPTVAIPRPPVVPPKPPEPTPAEIEKDLNLTEQQIAQIQLSLNILGYPIGSGVGVVTGYMGEVTRSKLKEWQKFKGFPVTGYLTRDQLKALFLDAAPAYNVEK